MGSNTSDFEDLLFRLRATSISLMVCEQRPCRATSFILSAAAKFVFRLSGRDAWGIGELLNLTREQTAALRELATGECITVYAHEKFPYPFLHKWPKAPEIRHLSREEIQALSVQSVQPWLQYVVPEHVTAESDPGVKEAGGQLLTVPEFAVFVRIVTHEPETIAERCVGLGVHRDDELVGRRGPINHGLLVAEEHTIGNRKQFWYPSRKGLLYAKELKLQTRTYKSGPGHEWMVAKLTTGICGQVAGTKHLTKDSKVAGRQPDRLFLLPGESGHRVALQGVSSPNFKREAKAMVDIASLSTIDLVLVVTAKSTFKKTLQDKLGDITTDSDILKKIRFVYIEDCLVSDFDFASLLRPLV